jgi:hypothetical protein
MRCVVPMFRSHHQAIKQQRCRLSALSCVWQQENWRRWWRIWRDLDIAGGRKGDQKARDRSHRTRRHACGVSASVVWSELGPIIYFFNTIRQVLGFGERFYVCVVSAEVVWDRSNNVINWVSICMCINLISFKAIPNLSFAVVPKMYYFFLICSRQIDSNLTGSCAKAHPYI